MKKILLTLLMLVAATAIMSAQDETEQTPAPMITIYDLINEIHTPDYGDGFTEAYVEISHEFTIEMPDDIMATIYFKCIFDGYDYSDWMEYTDPIRLEGTGYVIIKAFAVADGMTQSDVVSNSCINSVDFLYWTYYHEGIHYYLAERYSYDVAVFSGGDPHNPDEPNYSGNIVIPSEIECQGATYTVNEIYDNAFTASDVLSVDLPNTIGRVGYGAFIGCGNMRKLICRAITPPRVYAAFQDYDDTSDEIYHTVTLYVPAESVEAYRNDWEWGRFARIVPFIGAGPGDVDGDYEINIADVTVLIDQLLSGEELPAYFDVDGDGVVNIKDLTDLIDMLLAGN